MQPAAAPTPLLRPFAPADTPAIKSLVFSILQEFHLQPDPSSTDADLDDIHAHYILPGGSFSVLQSSNSSNSPLVGCVGIFPLSPTLCELRKMYLAPSHRGQGLGKLLLQHALAEARRLHFQRITLETAAPLTAAIHLYTQHGFRPYQPSHLAPRCDQAYYLDLL